MSKVSEVLLVECMYCVMVLTFFLFYQLDHSGQRFKYSMIQYWFDGTRLKSNQSHMAIHIQALHFSYSGFCETETQRNCFH